MRSEQTQYAKITDMEQVSIQIWNFANCVWFQVFQKSSEPLDYDFVLLRILDFFKFFLLEVQNLIVFLWDFSSP